MEEQCEIRQISLMRFRININSHKYGLRLDISITSKGIPTSVLVDNSVVICFMDEFPSK